MSAQRSKDVPRSASGGSTRTGARVVREESGVKQELQAKADERDRAMHDVWVRTLAQIPTKFGRFTYVASLRDENSGTYQYFKLALRYTDEEADCFLRASHEQIFREWLNFPLERQRGEVAEYLESIEGERAVVLQTWLTSTSYRNLVPTSAHETERLLFISDLELILEILRTELSA